MSCEADLSTTSQAPSSDTRVPRADEDERRSQRAQRAPPEGAKAPRRLLLQEVASTRAKMPCASGQTGASTGGDERFSGGDRLKKRYEFRHVQLTGRRTHTPHFLIVVQSNALHKTRLGITVTKKVGTAVERNRIKRVVREVFRRNRSLFPQAHDVVFIAKRGAYPIDYETVLDEVRRAAKRLRSETGR